MRRKMTQYANPHYSREEITTAELLAFLVGKRVTLDCGHHYCIHPLSNSMVLSAEGVSRCHECYD